MELWRVLWRDCKGWTLEVEVADLGALHEVPACQSGNDLAQYLGEWVTLVNEQGQDLPARHLTTLLLSMRPAEV